MRLLINSRQLSNILCSAAFIASISLTTSFAGAQTDVDKDISINEKVVGHLTLDHQGAFQDIPGGVGGATLDGNFQKTNDSLQGDVRWVQVITTTHPLNTNAGANNPYFDPGELDPSADHEPFYWNTPLQGNDGNDYNQFWWETYNKSDPKTGDPGGIQYFDMPSRSLLNVTHWEAELSLTVRLPGNRIAVLWTGVWGFDIDNVGTVTSIGINKQANPTAFTQALLNSYNSFWDDPWTIVDAKEAIPAPGPLALLLIASLLPITRRRRRAA